MNTFTNRHAAAGLLDQLSALARPAAAFDVDARDQSRHSVSLHESDDGLCELVSAFLMPGAVAGERLLVIATEPHIAAIEHRLRATGFDVRGALSSGRLRLIGVQDALSKIMVESTPDWQRLARWSDSLLNDGGGRPRRARVRAYVEMCSTLWQSGNRDAAARLEAMWTRLQQAQSFSLLCGYDMAAAYEQGVEFCHHVCATHTHALRLDATSYDAESATTLTATPLRHLRRCGVDPDRHEEPRRPLRDARRALREVSTEQGASLRQLELLTSTAIRLASARNLQDACGAALDAAEALIGGMGSAVLVPTRGGDMRVEACRGVSEELVRALTDQVACSEARPASAATFVGDLRVHATSYPDWCAFEREHVAAFAAQPLMTAEQTLGTLIVCYAEPQPVLRQRGLLQAVAAHAAAALARFAAAPARVRGLDLSLEMFAGILGHELRTPLQTIRISADLALGNLDLSAANKALARIAASSQRMSRLIEHLIDFTRARAAGAIPITPAAVDLEHLLRSVVEELSATHADCHLSVERVKGNTRGLWDKDRLLQVFSNLINNAVQHGCREHGVQLSIDGTGPDAVRVEVHNMGVVPRALLPRLFEPLVRDQRSVGHSGGLGLGLYISQEILRAHGGSISVRSSEASGTTFSVDLPRVSTAQAHGA